MAIHVGDIVTRGGCTRGRVEQIRGTYALVLFDLDHLGFFSGAWKAKRRRVRLERLKKRTEVTQ